jgi:hypothetical protein
MFYSRENTISGFGTPQRDRRDVTGLRGRSCEPRRIVAPDVEEHSMQRCEMRIEVFEKKT